ncbi:MAG: radical SAM protein [Deferribacterota bacterium]|nr:radical SAM protein [Deferribacterota bacterium]
MNYIFGPVASKRFGRSLGVNILPHKVCSYDCVYCEVGKTTVKTITRKSFFDVNEILKDFNKNYSKVYNNLDVITITGSGEPTLNADIGTIIKEIKKIAANPIMVLTNGSLLWNKEVQKDLYSADIICVSLDAAKADIFRKINKPEPQLNLENIINGLIEFSMFYNGRLLIESLFVKDVNDSTENLSSIVNILKKCKFDSLQINTIYRPPSYIGYNALSEKEISTIKNYFENKGISIFKKKDAINRSPLDTDYLVNYIKNTATLRPITIDEILSNFNVEKKMIEKIIRNLILNEELYVVNYEGRTYFLKENIGG